MLESEVITVFSHGLYHSPVLLLFSRVVSAVAVFSCNRAGSFDRLLALIKLESPECMC